MPLKSNAIKVHEQDNVAVATRPIPKGGPVVVDGEHVVNAAEDIQPGHKTALQALAAGDRVYRYGEPIVEAIRQIAPGEWVHVHNTRPIPAQ